MAEKTIQGKKCPHCASFVRDGLKTCPVCGFGLKPGAVRTRPETAKERIEEEKTLDLGEKSGVIICDKCGTENGPDFRFCKICKHPLKNLGEPGPVDVSGSRPGKTADIRLVLDWKKIPSGFQPPEQIRLKEFLPYFNGVGEWLGYVFFVFQTDGGYHILIRKTDPASAGILFRRWVKAFSIESGTEFYLGAVRFQVLGDLGEQPDTKTVIRSEKTVLKGPGERDIRSDRKGGPRIKPIDVKSASGESEIREKILLGRDWLFKNLGCDPEDMRKNGISQEHALLSPMAGGLWFLEPLNDRPVFEAIEKIPVVLNDGECLRYLSPAGPAEFVINLKPGR